MSLDLLNSDNLDESFLNFSPITNIGNIGCGNKPSPVIMRGVVINQAQIDAWNNCNKNKTTSTTTNTTSTTTNTTTTAPVSNAGCGDKPSPVIVGRNLINKAQIDAWYDCVNKNQSKINGGCGIKPAIIVGGIGGDIINSDKIDEWNDCMSNKSKESPKGDEKPDTSSDSSNEDDSETPTKKTVKSKSKKTIAKTSDKTGAKESSNKSEDSTEIDAKKNKFLGMPKAVGITVTVVGGLALLTGTFFLIKKLKK